MKLRAFHLLMLLGAATGSSYSAETLSVVPDSAQALSMPGGRFANLQDASALRVSPANILEIEQTELLLNTAMWNGDIRFDATNGASVKMSESWIFPGSIYLVVPVKPGKLAFGVGVSTPFGMASKYPKDMDPRLRYSLPYESSLLAVSITPAVALKVTNSLSVAAGLDIIYSRLSIKRIYPWGALPGLACTPDGAIEFQGNGLGLGAYLGVNWEIFKGHRLALVGRLPVTVNYEGEFKAQGLPVGTPTINAIGATPTSRFGSDMTFPGSIALGYGIDLSERLTVGFDFQWSNNSSHNDIPLFVGNNQPLLNGTNRAVLAWEDSIDLGMGMSYALDENWTARCGYLFSENSQTAVNYTPAVAVNDRHVFGVGAGWQGKKHGFDLAYAFIFNPIRTISGAADPAFNGRYKHQWHVVSLSYTRRF